MPLIAGNESFLIVSAFFASGALIYLFRFSIPLNLQCLLVLVLAAFMSKDTLSYSYFCSMILIYFVFLMAFWKKVKVPSLLDDCSYGVYLYSWLLQKLVHYYLPEAGLYRSLLLVMPASILLGIVSWRCIEKRCLSLRHHSFGVLRSA